MPLTARFATLKPPVRLESITEVKSSSPIRSTEVIGILLIVTAILMIVMVR